MTCKNGDLAICPDRAKALFFDNIHPTEVVHQTVAARYYTAQDPSDAYPYDIQKLAALEAVEEHIFMEGISNKSYIQAM